MAGVWIGMRSGSGRGRLAWVDGSRTDYTNWRFGQPDGAAGGGSACVVSEYEPLQRWADGDCGVPRGFVCKQAPVARLRDAVQSVSSSSLKRCPQFHRITKLGLIG